MAQQTPLFTCCAWPPPLYFSLPHLAQDDKRYKEAKGNGSGLERCCAQEKGWTKGTICFSFSLPYPSSLGCSGPAFQWHLSFTFFQLLDFHVPLLAQSSWRPLAAPLPWPRPSQAAMEMSFCLGNILLFGHSLKIVSPSPSRLLLVTLPPLSIPGGYFGISVQVNSYLT